MNTLKFHVFALAATFGIVWGAAVLLLGLAASLLGWGVPMVRLLGTVYLGYEPDLPGTLIGTAWAAQKAKVTVTPRVDEDTLAMNIKPVGGR